MTEPLHSSTVTLHSSDRWLVVDVGNSRIKLAVFRFGDIRSLPDCEAAWTVPLSESLPWPALGERCRASGCELHAVIAGSNQQGVDRVLSEWPAGLSRPPLVMRSSEAFPIEILVEQPRRVGLDRILNAVAASVIAQRQRSAIVVDCGTATTVDLVRADGAFLGGAILPGFALCALALHHYTEVLPLVSIEDIIQVPPEEAGHPPLGRNTQQAIMSGVFWGQVGAVRELVSKLKSCVDDQPHVLLSGGGSKLLVPHIPGAAYYPYLAMQGLVLVASQTVVENARNG